MNKHVKTGVILAIFLLLGTGIVFAQQERGEIHGAVYEDVNGDGLCINTNVAGEDPVEGINVEFVSSDEKVVITLQTGSDGTFGLVAAGQSIWRVTAKPDSTKWVVTSENPLYSPVLPETGLVQTDVNFCIQKGGSGVIGGSGNAVIILPESGAARDTTSLLLMTGAVLGIALIGIGLYLEIRRQLL